MDSKHITVIYKWTAHEGKLNDLAEIYKSVTSAMERDEPGAEVVHTYVSESENSLYVRDEFVDAGALAFHLQNTAAAHFPQLLQVATPGSFFFLGEVPEELQQATRQMGLASEFSSHLSGFER